MDTTKQNWLKANNLTYETHEKLICAKASGSDRHKQEKNFHATGWSKICALNRWKCHATEKFWFYA